MEPNVQRYVVVDLATLFGELDMLAAAGIDTSRRWRFMALLPESGREA